MLVVVIASRQRAPRYGPGRLVVDGSDTTLLRKATFAFDPSPVQERRLLALLAVCCEVYNAALAERREAWTRRRTRVTLFDQFNQVTGLRRLRDDVLLWGIQPVRGALRRCDEAFAGFFARVAAGQTPGYPRFRCRARFDTACWDQPVSWTVDLTAETLHVQGVGRLRLPKGALRQLRRLRDRGGSPVTLTVTRRRAGSGWVWRATVAFKGVKTQPAAAAGSGVVGVDRGVAVTAALSDGRLLVLPPWMVDARRRIAAAQRERAGKQKGSRAWRACNRRVARAHAKAARRGDAWARDTARAVVAAGAVIALEDLHLAAMTRSAKGTVDNPGRNVAAKTGLNRSLQDAALGRLAHWVLVKAEEAGRRAWLVDPANTSRGCARCGHVDAANRPSRDRFACTRCGHQAHADVNAAVNIAARGAASDAAWRAAGAPPLARPTPRLQRRTTRPRSASVAAAP